MQLSILKFFRETFVLRKCQPYKGWFRDYDLIHTKLYTTENCQKSTIVLL